jgi:hypothetical protein
MAMQTAIVCCQRMSENADGPCLSFKGAASGESLSTEAGLTLPWLH